MASEDAAVEAGVSQAVGTRWFREAGGMPPSKFRCSAKPLSGRYLSFAEREEIALLRVAGLLDAGGRAPARSGGINDLPRAAAQRCHTKRRPGVSRDDRAMACRAKPLAVPSRRSLCSTRHCEPMWRNDWLASSSLLTGAPVRGPAVRWKRPSAWTAARPAVGKRLEPANRSPVACRSTSRTMRPCASATKPSINRCSSKVEARCVAS